VRMLPLILSAAVLTSAAAVAAMESKPVSKPPAKAAAAKYDETKLKALEAKLAKKPSDAKLKSETAEANFQVGYAMMINENLPPRVKYPGALKHYRRALALNPKHAKAAENKKMIEDIYKSMGRPVPS
jgi:tetratricopeptide (TPR) repeat protein